MDFSVKEVPPPVPLKTYQWEDLKRDKERGKYPYTYLSKNLLVEQDNMTTEDKKPLVSAEGEKAEDEQKMKVVQRRKEDIHATKEESEHNENKEEKTISDENERITMRQDSTDDIEIKYELLVEDESLDQTDRMPDISKADSKKRESEDTNRESNIEQYFDKEQILQNVLDSSGVKVVTAIYNAGFVHDSKNDFIPSVSETLEVPQDHKRKHSGSSEGTKSNLSLFEKIKNSKFKVPTFAIPQFKTFTFHKKGSKRVKHESKEQKLTLTEVGKSEVTLQRRACDSPVYIHIPLNPTAEDLEKERQEAMKSESHRRLASDFRSDRLNGSKDTNGTLSSASAARNVDVQSTSSKWKGLHDKADKQSPPFTKKSKDTNAKGASLQSVTKNRDDSPVEYIYIPLKPPETWDKPSSETERSFNKVDQVEAVNTKLISTQTQVSVVTKVDKAVVKEEEEIITETKEPQKPEMEIKQLPKVISKSDVDKTKGAIKKNPDDTGKNTKFTKDIKKLVSKLTGETTKTKRDGSSFKAASKQTSVEKKTLPISKNHTDLPVEYIYIPLKGPLPAQNPEQVDVKRKENISTKPEIPGVTVAIVEKEKPSVMSKFKTEQKSPVASKKGINQFTGKKASPKSPKKESVDKKSSPLMPSVKSSDSPVEYIYIPLKPLDAEVSEELLKCTDDKAEGTLMELKASKENSTIEIEQKPKEALIKQVEGQVTKLEEVPDKPKETQKDNIMTKLKGLKLKKTQAPKQDVKTMEEQVTEKIKSPPKDLKSSDAPVEYIYIPLKPPADPTIPEESVAETVEATTVSEILLAQSSSLPLEEPKRRKIEDNTEEARLIMEAVIRAWQGFKTKPLQKPMPLKRTEPKMTSPKAEKTSGSVVFGGGESPVEYIYIPLNPTEEQLECERAMKEQKRLASSAARTSKCSVGKTGAIKKQPTEKSNTIKDTTTKLTEDIKKFASKLKDMKKSKNPTFKTFKHGSKSTMSKKPVDSRSPPTPRQHKDTPVEYIFIPLKGPKTTEETLKEARKDIQAAAATSIPSEIGDKIEEAVKISILAGPHYELLTKEDEEDGLKTAIIASQNEMKPSDEVLKTEDSLKLNRKPSIELINMEEVESGLDKSQDRDENAIYEDTIQTKDEEPDTSVSTARKLVTVAVDEQIIKDTSLEDDHNKWSKSRLLAVC